jgi:hypothetical protein
MTRILLGSVVGNLFYYQLRRITEILAMAGFRAHESWQWAPVDE